MIRIRRIFYPTAIVGISVFVTVYQAVSRGQDVNWDQLNYHIGVPLLLARGTFWDSIAPAGIQSYFNPWLLSLDFLAIRTLPPIAAAVAFALAQSVPFMLAGAICAAIARPAGGWRALLLGLLGFALCLMAPLSLSEAGTTMTDLTLTAPVLAGYLLLLTRGQWIGPLGSAAAAGFLLGLATALKLTNGVYAIGAVGFAFAGTEPPGARFRWVLIYGCAAAGAFALVGGSWHVTLWSHFGNPFFPYYNNIFHSPDASAALLRDERFLPRSVLDIWRYPYYWSIGGSPDASRGAPSSELPFRDARWIVVAAGLTLFPLALPVFRPWARARLREPATGVLFAFAIDYLVWLMQFSIHRYALPLDILCGAILLSFAMLIRPRAAGIICLAASALVVWPLLIVTDWAHLPWRSNWRTIAERSRDIGPAAIVFLAEKPSLFIAASLSPDARFVGVAGDLDLRANNDTTLTRQLKRALETAPNARLIVVDHGTLPAAAAAILDSYRLRATGRCETSVLATETLRLCDVDRRP
jgi:hypothetical protein